MDNAKDILYKIDEIEKKLKENQDILKNNNTNMTNSLVDIEGFPLNTLDVTSVRKARHEIICLQNDYKSLMEEMRVALTKLPPNSTSENSSTVKSVHRTSNAAFLKIEKVEYNSPAHKAQLHSGDLLIQFNTIHMGNFENFAQLKKQVEENFNKSIKLTVFRPSADVGPHVHRLELIPQSWDGPGILGCAFTLI